MNDQIIKTQILINEVDLKGHLMTHNFIFILKDKLFFEFFFL